MDYFQAPSSSTTGGGADGQDGDMTAARAQVQSSDVNPFNFNMPSSSPSSSFKLPSTSSSSRKSNSATTVTGDSSAEKAVHSSTTTNTTKAVPSSHASNNANGSTIGFREALMKRQGSSPSSFFSAATPRTPAASAHPLRPSASSMGVVSTAEITTTGSNSNNARWQKEYSSGGSSNSNTDAHSTSPANPASSNSSPKRSMSSWLSKSPRSPPAISTSTDVNSKTLPTSSSRPTSSSKNSFFTSNPNSTSASSSTTSSPAVHCLQRSTTTFTNSDRYSESPLDIPSKSTPSNTASTTSNATSTTTAPAPPAAPAAARPSAGKTISSSSSSSTSSGKTVTDGNNASSSQGGQAGPSMTSQSSTSSTSTTTTATSTSPKEAHPTTTTSSSGATDLKQRSCPIPSLRMPFTGGGGSGSKLPSGACASLPMPSMKLGTTGARTGITRAFGGAVGAISRKGPEVVQNPRFKAVPVGEELKNLLSSSSSSSTSSTSSGATASNARGDTTLIVDLRPHTAFVGQGRLKGSINICVPSTLLRRPAFALNKIAETICSRKDQAHFNRILLDDETSASSSSNDEEESQKLTTNVIILDQETVLLSQESTVHSLMSKIEKAGYNGDIYWIRGGWNAISTHVESDNNVLAEYVDMELLNEDEEEEEEEMVEEEEIMQDEYTRDGEVEEESEGASSEMSDVQDTRTPRQPFPGMTSSAAAVGNENDAAGGGNGGNGGAGGAYFQNYLQGPRGINTKGRSSQSSFTSTASSDSLFPSSIASSQSSMGSGGGGGDSHHLHASSSYSKDRASSTSPVAPTFDSSKLHLPHLRPSTSPSHSTSSASSSTSSAPRGATVPTLTGPSKGKAAFLSSSGGALSLSSNTGKTRSTSAGGTAIIRPKNLPMAAFQYNSTAQGAHGDVPQKNNSNNIGKGQFQMGLDNDHHGGAAGAGSTGMEKQKSGSNPFGRKTAANPFFDNIRQNIESQSLDHVLEHVAPLEIPAELTKPTLVEHLPSFLKDLIKMTPKTRASKLHKEYFDIEQAEQRRLQKVLNWHCQQSVVVDSRVEAAKAAAKEKEAQEKGNGDAQMQTDDKEENPTYHPFSISAGVEKGHLNRYKNMWPYEHARVRLESVMSPTCGDYINASHIQLRGTSKRYIASQGPLEQTTEHFWRLVLQENVHVIVMLTLLQEGGREKCSNYFQSGTYGDIQINLVEEKGSEEAMKKSVCKDFGFFSIDEEVPKVDSPADAEPGNVAKSDRASQAPFYASTPLQANDSVKMKKYSVQTPSGNSQMQGHKRSLSRRLDSAIVRRTIEIRRRSDPPDTPPKVVRHIQYIKWPDFDIPPDPNVVIDLISETNKAQRLDDITGEESPVLVHCSAGVGRTGTFIAVDTLLERYRRERREARTSGSPSNGPPRARMRRSGSDLGSSLHDLSLTDADKSSVQSPTTGGNSGQKVVEDTPRVRPPALRSSSSQETPRHLQARLGIKELLPEDHSDPILSLVDQMREQRMSSVANAGQYIFTYLALLAGISQELAEEGVTAASPVA